MSPKTHQIEFHHDTAYCPQRPDNSETYPSLSKTARVMTSATNARPDETHQEAEQPSTASIELTNYPFLPLLPPTTVIGAHNGYAISPYNLA